ncbi:MAG: hypothetical protein C4523_15535 [Myxococcales bacterium]|nr:MAG: hypothetical protein C4523_15535 [Myxococcales bacterium]
MSAILYARVSTGVQAQKDLSIPALLRAARQLAQSRGWPIASEYHDVSSGRALKGWPGLAVALKRRCRCLDPK